MDSRQVIGLIIFVISGVPAYIASRKFIVHSYRDAAFGIFWLIIGVAALWLVGWYLDKQEEKDLERFVAEDSGSNESYMADKSAEVSTTLEEARRTPTHKFIRILAYAAFLAFTIVGLRACLDIR